MYRTAEPPLPTPSKYLFLKQFPIATLAYYFVQLLFSKEFIDSLPSRLTSPPMRNLLSRNENPVKSTQRMQPFSNSSATAGRGSPHARRPETESNLMEKLCRNDFTNFSRAIRPNSHGNDKVWWKNILRAIISCLRVAGSTSRPSVSNRKIVHGKWKLGNKLGSGGYGQVYEAEDLQTGRLVAVKIETIRPFMNTFRNESQVYKAIRQNQDNLIGFPECIFSGKISSFRQCLVLQKLGRSVWSLMLRGQISRRTAFDVGIQGLQRLEDLHRTGYVHGDVKPDNFVMGLDDPRRMYLIDFGLSRRYLNDDGRHALAKPTMIRMGTVQYSSIDNHFGMPKTRRSDLESFGYVILELLEGYLPWTDITGFNYVSKVMKAKKYFLFGTNTRTKLCPEIAQYFEYIRGLQFDEKPRYSYLRGLFRRAMERL